MNPIWRRHSVQVARIDLLDLLRVRSTWFALLFFPVINVVLIVVLPGLLTQREQTRQETKTFVVAAQGAAGDVAALADDFGTAGLHLEESSDARRAVIERAAVLGVLVPEGSAEALAGEGSIELRVYVLGTRDESRLAVGKFVAEVEKVRTAISTRRTEARALPPSAIQPVIATSVDLADTERGGRLDLAGVIPLLLLLPLSGTIGIAGQRISGAKDQRVLEPLLLLPLTRRTLLAGKLLAGLTLGSVTVPAVAAPLALGRLVPIGGTGQRINVPLTTLGAIVGMAAVMLVVLVALGLCAGAASRTSAELGSILPFVSFPVILLALSLQFLGDLASSPLLVATPLLGPVLVARDLTGGVAQGGDIVLAVATSLGWAALLLGGAAALLERDSAVLRKTTA